MRAIKQINTKNRTYYFYNDAVWLKTDKKSYKDIGIYNIGYITTTKN